MRSRRGNRERVGREVIELTGGEALKDRVSLQTQFTKGLPTIAADRVQLQQVVLNLIVTALQEMSGVSDDDTRQVLVTTRQTEPNEVYLGVQDAMIERQMAGPMPLGFDV